MNIYIYIGSFILLASGAAPAMAGTDDDVNLCAAKLDPTKIAMSKSVADRYTYSQLTQGAENNSSSFGLGVVLPVSGIPIGAKLDQAKSDAQSHLSNIGINFSHDEQLGYALSYLPKYLGDQFVECIDRLASRDDGGVSIGVKSAAADNAIVTINVHPTKSREWFKRKLIVSTNGVTTDTVPKKFDDKGGRVDLIIRRINLSKDIIVRAEVDTVLGQPTTDTLVIPWKPIETEVTESPPAVPVRCGQKNYGRWYSQDQAVLTAKPNEIFFLDTINTNLGTGIPATSGDKPWKFPQGVTDPASRGFDIEFASPLSIGGHSWCQIAAFENPGWNGTFSVLGKTVARPADVGPPMSEMVAVAYRSR